jgi:hypothetical protein
MRLPSWTLLALGVSVACGRTANSSGTDSGTTGGTAGTGGSAALATGGSSPSSGGSGLGGFLSPDSPDASPPIETCGGEILIEVLATEVVVVVDRSTGMIESAPDDRPWLEVVEDALTRFVELPFVSDVPLALGYFPPDQDQPSTCEAPFELEVPYATASDNAELVRTSLTAQMPSGDRPLDHALEGAIAIAQARPASAVRQLVAVIAAGPADACEPRTSSDCGAPVSAAGVDTALIALGAAADTPELAEPARGGTQSQEVGVSVARAVTGIRCRHRR